MKTTTDMTTAGGGGAELVPARTAELPLDRNPAAVYLASLGSPRSKRTMRDALEIIAALLTGGRWADGARGVEPGRCGALELDWSAVRYQHVAAIRSALAERYAPATANLLLAALKGAAREAWQLELLSSDDYQRIRQVKGVKAERLPRGRALSSGEIRVLFEACAKDAGPAGVRDAGMFALLYGAGLRRAELAALDLADYDTETGALTVRAGKGRKDRTAYATNGARAALRAWLEARRLDAGPLFVPVNKAGRIEIRRLTTQAVWNMVVKRCGEAGLRATTPHDFRRSFVSDLLDNGVDLVTVQRLAGHANAQTTARYDRRGEEVKRRAAQTLHVPFAGR